MGENTVPHRVTGGVQGQGLWSAQFDQGKGEWLHSLIVWWLVAGCSAAAVLVILNRVCRGHIQLFTQF